MRGSAAFVLVVLAGWLAACVESTSLYCDDDTDCAKHGLRSQCNRTQHVCVDDDALNPDDLTPTIDGAIDAEPAQDGGDMVPPDRCIVTSDCVDEQTPVCGASGACEACDSELDDAVCLQRAATTPRCRLVGAGAGRCVACRETSGNVESADCTGATTPVCDGDGSCRACAANDECQSGVCDFGSGGQAGRCVPAGEIIHVDNRNLAIAACNTMFTTQNGSVADPYCDVDQAIDAVATRPVLWLAVAGHAASYSPLSLTGVTHDAVIVRGPGSTVAAAAAVTIKGATTSVAVNTAGLQLELAGVVIDGSITQDGVVVTAAERVTLSDVLVQNCGSVGVQVNSAGGELHANHLVVKKTAGVGILINTGAGAAQLTDVEVDESDNEGMRLLANGPVLDRIYVHRNCGGGIEVGPIATARIANALVRSNGSSTPGFCTGVSVFGGIYARGTLHLVNASVVYNKADTASFSAGVRCANGNGLLLNVVVLASEGIAATPDISSTCTVYGSAYPFATTPVNSNVSFTGCTPAQVFADDSDPIDYHPNPTAPDGCKLRNLGLAAGGGATAPSADYAGTSRPQEGAFDIGAYESLP